MKVKANVLIINAHWNNRGDEAALRSLIDSLSRKTNSISVQLQSTKVLQFPYKNVKYTTEYPRLRNLLGFILSIITNFKYIPSAARELVQMMQQADIIIHAPGGPSIGDIYGIKELNYLAKFWAANKMRKPYIFAAPSAGPFQNKCRNIFRRKMYRNAQAIVLREEVSQGFLNELLPQNKSIVTCDLALQNDINFETQNFVLGMNQDLIEFLADKKVVGVTITDLLWHPIHGKNKHLQEQIRTSFTALLENITSKGYKVIFIPQLFGLGNDYALMEKYCINSNCLVLSDQYDTYFQQFLISKLYAVVGMRYHSNIFSAKMGIPFVSISYEQKMKGFMKKIDLLDYCVDIKELSSKKLIDRFNALENNQNELRKYLSDKALELKVLSHKTIDIIEKSIDELEK